MKQWGVYMDYGYTPNPDLKGFSNDHPFPPEIVVDSPYLQQRQQQLMAQIDAVAAGARLGADAHGRRIATPGGARRRTFLSRTRPAGRRRQVAG